MAASQSIDELITGLEQSIDAGLGHFARLWDTGQIKMGKWGPRETLCHLMWWIQATAEGIESVTSGGKPYRIYASDEEMNARAVGRVAGRTIPELADMTRVLQARLVTATRDVSDLSATVLIHGDGREDSVRQRFETMTHDWNACAEELQTV